MDGEELDVKEFLINGEFVKVAVRLSGGPLFKKKPPPFAVVAADGGFLERNRKKGYLLLR